MIREVHFAVLAGVLAGLLMPCASPAQTFELDSTKGLQPHDVTVEAVTYRGRKAVRVLPAADAEAELVAPKNGEGGGIAVLSGHRFITARLRWMFRVSHGPGPPPMLADSLVLPSG
jgi:hypothetical protein